MSVAGLLGRKLGMTQVFASNGTVVGVTVIQAGPCTVTQVKTESADGYAAAQLGFEAARRPNRPARGHLKAAGANLRHLREFAADGAVTVGDQVDVGIFAVGGFVDVASVSKGRGFAGGVRRHGFAGGPKTHGQTDRHRAPGSIGAGTTPGRVWKGTRMAGHMGAERVTVQNLRVIEADVERGLLLVAGSVPGSRNGLVEVRQARKRRGKG